MPLTVITLKKSPPSLRGDLTKWMQEISTGVYVGNFNSKIRSELWKRVIENVGMGTATMSYACRNEIGYNFEIHNSNKIPIDFDGIPLVMTPAIENSCSTEYKYGFSNAAKILKAKRYKGNISSIDTNTKPYVIIDLETTGLDYINNNIIEIGAIKIAKNIEEYSCIVKQNITLPNAIKILTGISDAELKNGKDESVAIKELCTFIGDKALVGYNVNFDIKFINEALKRNGQSQLTNKVYDVMKYVKRDKMFLKNYKLDTVLSEYGINIKVPHRAIEDVKIIRLLISKLDGLTNKLKIQK
jgi:CRISPR-associated endoribonuclease cas2